MGDTSRKVKNPLLSAAGVTFPFEDFAGNAVLMPVTPASSSVLRDEGEIASFVGQRQPGDSVEDSFSELSLGPPASQPVQQHQHFEQHNQHLYQPPASEVYISSSEQEPQTLGGSIQSQNPRQGYLSSFLSSLPNLSLSSITGDKEDDSFRRPSIQNDQPPPPTGYYPSYYPESTNSPYPPNERFPPPPTDPSQITPPLSFLQPLAPHQPSPAVQPPPTVPPPTGIAPSNYRLGNQRRVKYAPPPDLATSSPRVTDLPASLPPQPSVFPAQVPPTFYPQTNPIPNNFAPPGVLADLGQKYGAPGVIPLIPHSQLNTSYTSSPGADLVRSHPLGIPSNSSSGSLHRSYPEPATPQNTPANSTLLSNFQQRDWSPTPNSVQTQPSVSQTPTTLPLGTTTVLGESGIEFSTISSSDSSFKNPSDLEPLPSSPFAPISAVQVSEKLEHLLAERTDTETETKPSDTPKLASPDSKSTEVGSSSSTPLENEPGLKSVPLASCHDTPIESAIFKPTSDTVTVQQDNNSTAAYFTSNSQSSTGVALFDPINFQGPSDPVAGHFSGFQTSAPPSILSHGFDQSVSQAPVQQSNDVPLYDPTKFLTTAQTSQIQTPFTTNATSYLYTPAKRNDEPAAFLSPPSPPPMATPVPEPTGSATLDPIQMSINPLGGPSHANPHDSGPTSVPPSLHNLAAGGVGGSKTRQMTYRPVYQHWFHRKEVENKVLWIPFSMPDSLNLEEVHNSSEITPETVLATDGGRYDVDILRRQRSPVYWSGAPNEVRRCSWFYKGPGESRYVPYEESVAARLEEEYQQACNTDVWNRRIEMNNGEYIIFHSPTVQVHYLQPDTPELTSSWGNNVGGTGRPRVVKRGVDEFNIDEGEPEQVDHLLFLVHGIGSVCDLKFRSVEEVVDEFRSISLQLVQSHYRTASEQGIVNKIEVLPISWHTTLHSDDTGIDKKLQAITLESIPKLRHFTNDTLLDILFYTSPIYCQTIMQTVGNEMNRLYSLFKQRNPSFGGGVYLGGHSLGSLILFDLLCHQKPPKEDQDDEENAKDADSSATENTENVESKETTLDEVGEAPNDTVGPIPELKTPVLKRRLSRKISYVMGAAGTGQPFINYPQLSFNPNAFFAFGSPIGMFVTVRGIDNLGEDFRLPTCPSFFNIFHPFDPVAYRIESLIVPDAHKHRPMLIPHHKGRKRMHLELKETMARVGADLKQKLLDSVRNTWNSVYQLAMFHKPDNQTLQREIDKVVEEQLQSATSETETIQQQQNDESGADIKIGALNGGRRIDYVLQEAPFEYINEYIFALTSHVCYWESEDTMLLILKEIYGAMGIQTDAQLPQQTMTIERSTPSPSVVHPTTSSPYFPTPGTSGSRVHPTLPPARMGMDPTAPVSDRHVGPPPISGFVRKS